MNSGPAGYRWRVKIFKLDNLKNSLGDTAIMNETFPVGSSEHAIIDNWRVAGPGDCEQLVARVFLVGSEPNDVSEFRYLDNNRVELNFQVCP
jgi:hypothetical protein